MKEITENIYHVGDNECSVYLVDTQSDQGLVLIDAGMNISMIKNIASSGVSFSNIRHCILTHCHIDHIGACADLKKHLPHIQFYAHTLDASAIQEEGYDRMTAASWYGVHYQPVKLDKILTGDHTCLTLGNVEFQCIHTPGHTPGSISILLETDKKKVLFGQDLHGPFHDDFHSNLKDYQKSMQILLDLNADILCEGHFGIFQPADTVRKYIEHHKKINRPHI
jgi:glyoxylase-like metal-dependent hydrolase (beta-lactamase superfamily II)